MKILSGIAIATILSLGFMNFWNDWVSIKKIEIQNETRKTDIEVNKMINEICPYWGEFEKGELRCFKNGKKYNIQEL